MTAHRPAALATLVAAILLAAAPAPAPAQTAPDSAGSLREQFQKRLEALGADDLTGALALAEWGVDQELFAEADGLYRAVLDRDPDNDEAFGALWYLADRPLAKDTEALRQARAGLPDAFVAHETRRYVILSDADPSWVREQGRRLERAYEQFVRFANRLDLRPRPPRHKLVAVVFSRLDDFAPYSAEDGNVFGGRIAGYYSPAGDRLVFYHVESNENVARARAQLEGLAGEIDALRRATRRTSSTGRRAEARSMREDLERRMARHDEQLARVDAIARQQSVSVTVHEAVHQLMFHSRVQSPYVQHPIWLSEGLATAFETDNVSSGFGPGQEFEPRRRQFWHFLDEGRLLPLRELVTVSHEALAARPETIHVVYHQSYALMTWLCRARKLELREYLRRLNALPPPATPSPEKLLEIFEAAFGDVDRLEEAWLRSES